MISGEPVLLGGFRLAAAAANVYELHAPSVVFLARADQAVTDMGLGPLAAAR